MVMKWGPVERYVDIVFKRSFLLMTKIPRSKVLGVAVPIMINYISVSFICVTGFHYILKYFPNFQAN